MGAENEARLADSRLPSDSSDVMDTLESADNRLAWRVSASREQLDKFSTVRGV